MKEKVLEILTKNSNGYTRIIKARYKDFYNLVDKNYIGCRFGEKLYRWINNDINNNLGKCPICNSSCKFDDIFYGFRKYCSSKCSNGSLEVQERKKKTYIEEYGVENPSQSDEIKEKKKQTCIDHFGIDCNLKTKETKEKIKQTCIEKYNSEYYLQSEKHKKLTWNKLYNKILNNNRLGNDIIPTFSLEDYKGIENNYIFKCKKCNSEFTDHIKDGRFPRCYKCNPIYTSYFEKEITEYIKLLDNNLIVETKNRIIFNNKMELDIYIPSKQLAIECDGIYYHSELSGDKDKNYHLNKTIECENKGLRLIHIFENEWMNKKEIIKNKLKHILGYDNIEKIYARKCIIKEIDNNVSNEFLEKYHLQGKDTSNIHIGLYYNDNELVSVMTFGKLRLALGYNNTNNDEYELLRYATSKRVVCGASKLLSYFIKSYKPKRIISYADRRWSDNNSFYNKIGFKFVKNTKINYFYTKDHTNIYHRFNFRKSELLNKLSIFDPELTEWENMQINGYDRIWDCGHLKYEMILS